MPNDNLLDDLIGSQQPRAPQAPAPSMRGDGLLDDLIQTSAAPSQGQALTPPAAAGKSGLGGGTAPRTVLPEGATTDPMGADLFAYITSVSQPRPTSVLGELPPPAPMPMGVDPAFADALRGEMLRANPQQRLQIVNAPGLRGTVARSLIEATPGLMRVPGPTIAPTPKADQMVGDLRRSVTNPVGRGVIAGMAGLGQVVPGLVQAGADLVGADGVAQTAGDTAALGRNVAGGLRPAGGNERLAFDVINSIVQSSPTLLVGFGGGPAMSTLFTQSAAQEYSQGRSRGLPGELAAVRAGIMAGGEVLGERFGFPEQIKIFKGLANAVPVEQLAPLLARQIVKEIPGEQLTTLVQFLGDKYGPWALEPEAGLAKYLEQAGETLKVTLGQTALMGGGPVVVSNVRAGMNRQRDRDLRRATDELPPSTLAARAEPQPAVAAPDSLLDDLIAGAGQSRPAATIGAPGVTVQAGPGFDATSLAGMLSQKPPPSEPAADAPAAPVSPLQQATKQYEELSLQLSRANLAGQLPREEARARLEQERKNILQQYGQALVQEGFETATPGDIEKATMLAKRGELMHAAGFVMGAAGRASGLYPEMDQRIQQLVLERLGVSAAPTAAGPAEPPAVAPAVATAPAPAATTLPEPVDVINAIVDGDQKPLPPSDLRNILAANGFVGPDGKSTAAGWNLLSQLNNRKNGGNTREQGLEILARALTQKPAPADAPAPVAAPAAPADRAPAPNPAPAPAAPPFAPAPAPAPPPADDVDMTGLPDGVPILLRDLARRVAAIDFKADGRTPDLAEIVRVYRRALQESGQEQAGQMLDGTTAKVSEAEKDFAFDKVATQYREQFGDLPKNDATIKAAILNGSLDISGQPWADVAYRAFKVDPAKIKQAAAPAGDMRPGVQKFLTALRAGIFSSPSYAAGTGKDGKDVAKAMNDQANADYAEAARLFLEGELDAKVPAGKADGLAVEVMNAVSGVTPRPIEKSAPAAKGWQGTLKALFSIVPKNDVRFYLKGVKLDEAGDRIMATDGHRLVVINQAGVSGNIPARPDSVKQSGDVIVAADGTWAVDPANQNRPIDGIFPDVDRVIPKESEDRTRAVSFNAAEFAAKARGIAKAGSYFNMKLPPPVAIQIDGEGAFFNPGYIVDMADMFRKLGYDTFNLSLQADGKGALLATSPDGKVQQVVMPLREDFKTRASFFAPIVGGTPALAAPASASGPNVIGLAYGQSSRHTRGAYSSRADMAFKTNLRAALADAGLKRNDITALLDRATTIHAQNTSGKSMTFMTLQELLQAAKELGLPRAAAPAKKTTPRKKAAAEYLADNGITDPEVVEAVAAAYDDIAGANDADTDTAQSGLAIDGEGAAPGGQADEGADADAAGQPNQQQLFNGQDRGPAPRQEQAGARDQSAAGAVNERAGRPERDDARASAPGRQSGGQNDGSEKSQRFKGASSGTVFEKASFTDRQSIYRDAFVELGYDPAEAELLPPARQFEILSKGLQRTYGLSAVSKSDRANVRESIDQLLDAYRGLQLMTHVLDLPQTAIGLNGTLGLILQRKGGFLGAYFPQGSGGKSTEGVTSNTPTIAMPGRSNSFAHEWGHALDYYLLSSQQGLIESLSGYVRKGEALSAMFPENVRDSFRLLLNSLFFDQAEQATKIMDLERRIEAAALRGVDATQLKAQLEAIKSGASKSRTGRSQFYENAGSFANQVGSDPDYWRKPTEMLARSFEAYVAHKVEAAGGSTEFIGKGDYAYQSDAELRLAKTFPKDADRFNIFRAYDLLFDAIREQALLNPQGATTAGMPGSVRLSDPTRYYDQQITGAQTPLLQRMWRAEKEAFQARARELEKLKNRPNDDRPLLKRMGDAVRALVETNRGVLLSMERYYGRRGNAAAASAIRAVTERIATDPGSGRKTAEGGTFAEAVERESRRFMTRLSNISTTANGKLLSDDQLAQITDVLTAIGGEAAAARGTGINEIAAPMRELLTDLYYYNRSAGLDIGFVKDQGYLPRLLDEPLVTANASEFIQDATRVYQIVFERDTERPSEADDLGAAIDALEKRIREAQLPKNDPQLQAYRDARRQLSALNRTLAQANKEGDGDKIDAAQAAMSEFVENNLDTFDEAYEYVRDQWSAGAAAEYQTRISYGSPESFSAHSPAGSFLKERVLPPEADKILAKYYIQDPFERVTRYVEMSVRKSEYNRRFGRDASNSKETNTKLYRMLERMVEAGVSKEDRDMVEKIVGQVTGNDRSSMPNQAQRTLGNIHALGQMTLLGRVVLTSLAEPMTVAVQTGKPLDALKAVALTVQEIASTGSVRERRAMARVLGIVSGDMADEMISNRLGGSFAQSPNMNRVTANYFRRVGLTGLTNAQRRSAMQLSGRYVLELAHTLEDADASATSKGHARAELLDAGIQPEQIDDFVAWSREYSDRMPRHDELIDVDGQLTDMGRIYAVMVGRLVNQAIQNPSAIDRPWAANTPIGRLTYGLLSFSMTFFRNVVMKSMKKVAREYEQRGAAHAANVAGMQVLAPLASLYMGHLIVTMAREALLNPDKWEEEEKKAKGFPIGWLAGLAFSRAGFTGIADPLYNALMGVKYQRDLSNILAGATPSFFLQSLERIAKYFILNSDDTNSAERNAARGMYELAIQPSLAYATGALPGGPMLGYGLGASYFYFSSPAFKSQWQDWLAGPKDSGGKRAGEQKKEPPL